MKPLDDGRKPHLFKTPRWPGLWMCLGEGASGFGWTPGDAYANWVLRNLA